MEKRVTYAGFQVTRKARELAESEGLLSEQLADIIPTGHYGAITHPDIVRYLRDPQKEREEKRRPPLLIDRLIAGADVLASKLGLAQDDEG